jgi:hypothetical protein
MLPVAPISFRQETSLSPPKDWPPSRPAIKPFTSSWTKPWSESTKICDAFQNWRTEFPDHPERSEPFKHWKTPSLCLGKPNQNQNTNYQNTLPVTDAGSEPREFTQWRSRSYSIMKSKQKTTRIKFWETRWRRFLNKTRTYLTKLRKNTRHHLKNSRRTQLWPWLQGQSPPTCSLNTARTVKINHKQKTCLLGENHFSANQSTLPSTGTNPECPDLQNQAEQPRRKQLLSGSYEIWPHHHSRFKQSVRWEKRSTFSQVQARKLSKLKSTKAPTTKNLFPKRRSESESYNQYHGNKSKNDLKSEDKDIKVKNERKPRSLLKTVDTEVTAKVDEVKTIEKALKEFRVEKEKQVDKKIEAESPVTLPPHSATTFNISILTFTIFILTFNTFVSIFNPFVTDPLDHHFQTFSMGDLSDCKLPHLARQTASIQADTLVKPLQTLTPYDLSRFLEPGLIYVTKNISRNTFVPNPLISGRLRKSENQVSSIFSS